MCAQILPDLGEKNENPDSQLIPKSGNQISRFHHLENEPDLGSGFQNLARSGACFFFFFIYFITGSPLGFPILKMFC